MAATRSVLVPSALATAATLAATGEGAGATGGAGGGAGGGAEVPPCGDDAEPAELALEAGVGAAGVPTAGTRSEVFTAVSPSMTVPPAGSRIDPTFPARVASTPLGA